MNEQLNLFKTTENDFNFDEMKQKLIDNLDMLKEMSVEEQTLYKKWQEMNKNGKMSKIKKESYFPIKKTYGNQPGYLIQTKQ